jgi:cytidylate kinase
MSSGGDVTGVSEARPVRSEKPVPGELITVSAAYGTGGSVVAPALAHRLGVPFLDRVTGPSGPLAVSDRRERMTAEEAKHTPLHRLLGSFTHAMPAGPTLSPPSPRHYDEDIRRGFEAEIFDLVAGGRGVILGRAAAVVLGHDRGFHVRLDGPRHHRLAQGARIEGVSVDEARAHMAAADKARTAYVRRLYRVDPTDSSLYHLVIDSTAVPLETVVELVLVASRAHAEAGSAP